MSKIKWRVRGDYQGSFSTYERALRRARHLRDLARSSQTVLEIEDGNETPVAEVRYPKRSDK